MELFLQIMVNFKEIKDLFEFPPEKFNCLHYSIQGSSTLLEAVCKTFKYLGETPRPVSIEYVERCWRRTQSTIRNLEDFCVTFKLKVIDWMSVIARYFVLNLLDLEIDYLKYHTLWLSYYGRLHCKVYSLMETDEPKKPKFDLNLSGSLLDKWANRQIKQRLWKNSSVCLIETLGLGLKRGCPSMKESLVERKIGEYVKQMNEPLPVREDLKLEVHRTAKEMWPDLVIKERDFKISSRAGVHAPVGKGGIRGFLLRKLFSPCSLFFWNISTELLEMGGDVFCREVRGPWSLDPLLFEYVTGKSLREGLSSVRISPIYEPLKVRLITKGDPWLYSRLKPYQTALWEGMQRFPIFKFTGINFSLKENRCNPKLVEDQLKIGPISGHDVFVSADYKASTDSFSMEYTKVAFDVAFGEFEQAKEWLWKAIGPQEYEDDDGNYLGTQLRGQLMGSPLSFPILCCINAALVRRAFELYYGKKFTLFEIPALVNGDDLLFRCDIGVWRIWREMTDALGWEQSAGKSFVSRNFCQINSTTFPVQQIYESLPYSVYGNNLKSNLFSDFYLGESFPFINFGWLEGMGKDVKCLDSPNILGSIHGYEEEVKFMSRLEPKIRKRVFSIWKDRLSDIGNEAFESGLIPYRPRPEYPFAFGGFDLGFSEGQVIDYDFALNAATFHRTKDQEIDILAGDKQSDCWIQRLGVNWREGDLLYSNGDIYDLNFKKARHYWNPKESECKTQMVFKNFNMNNTFKVKVNEYDFRDSFSDSVDVDVPGWKLPRKSSMDNLIKYEDSWNILDLCGRNRPGDTRKIWTGDEIQSWIKPYDQSISLIEAVA